MKNRQILTSSYRRLVGGNWDFLSDMSVVLIIAGLSFGSFTPAAAAEPFGVGAPLKTPTTTTVKRSCVVEHVKYCVTNSGGTRPDIACLQQHHTSLSLACRNILRQVGTGNGTAG